MGKAEENKQQKIEALFRSAYELFLSRGIEKTSIHDIAENAGVAKGTFYLYFKDKYDIRDRLIIRSGRRLFLSACEELEKQKDLSFEDKVIFVVDYVLDNMKENKPVLKFISKNLSWGIFRHAMEKEEENGEGNVMDYFYRAVDETPSLCIQKPKTMLFLIIELASSTSYSTMLENDPMSYEELKPYLNESIRAIIRCHMVNGSEAR